MQNTHAVYTDTGGQPTPVSAAASCRLSVVAPCHNEELNLDELVRRVSAVCRELVGDDYEIILVNDGSSDGTWNAIKSKTQTDPNIVGVDLSRNYGHQLALSAGLSYARGERILITDADLQDPPELLPEMMTLMDQGADVVYGQRLDRKGDSFIRKMASAVFYRLLDSLSDIDIPVDTGDFRLISRRVLIVLLSMPESHRYIRGMISWIGFKQMPVTFVRDERFQGETSYPLTKLIGLAINGLTGFSVRPLRLATYAGSVIALLSCIYAVYVLSQWFMHGVDIEGWPSLIVSISFLGGIQLLFLGIIGEYLGKLVQEVKGRPHFIVAETAVSDSLSGAGAGAKRADED